MARPKKTQDSFESDLKKLEKIVTKLEEGDLALADSIKAFEEGTQLAKRCENRLNKARQRVEILMEDKSFPWDEWKGVSEADEVD